MTKHHGYRDREYKIWRRMKNHCFNKRAQQYSTYGAAGVTVCREWRDDYARFLKDMGTMPEGTNGVKLLDRQKGYCKHNCVWALNMPGRTKRLVATAKPKDSPYKRVKKPKNICIALEKDLLEYIKGQSLRKSVQEGYCITTNDLIRDALERQFPRTRQPDMFTRK